jgi:hypothetical protein
LRHQDSHKKHDARRIDGHNRRDDTRPLKAYGLDAATNAQLLTLLNTYPPGTPAGNAILAALNGTPLTPSQVGILSGLANTPLNGLNNVAKGAIFCALQADRDQKILLAAQNQPSNTIILANPGVIVADPPAPLVVMSGTAESTGEYIAASDDDDDDDDGGQ